MSSYNPPENFNPIFNPNEYLIADESLTLAAADGRYLRLTGGIVGGLTTFNAGLNSAGVVNITDTTQSTNTSTGSLVISGGLGVAKNSHFGSTIHVPRGSAAAPTYAFAPDPTTGIFSFGSGQLNISTAGLTRLSIASSTITSTLSIVAPSGSATAPSYQLSAGSGCGIYSSTTDSINFSTAGVNRLTINSSGYLTLAAGQLVLPSGSVSAPAISWPSASINSGIYLIGTDNIGFSSDGVLRADYNTTRWLFSQPIQLQTTGGTASNLDFYEEYSHITAWNYGDKTNQQSLTIYVRRIGKMVMVSFTNEWSGSVTNTNGSTQSVVSATALPTRFRPVFNSNSVGIINIGGTTQPCRVGVLSNGSIEFTQTNGNGFTSGTSITVFANLWCYGI